MCDRNAEAALGLLARVGLEPARLLARTRHHDDLVGRELPQRVLDRLEGIGVAHLRFDARRLRLNGVFGLARYTSCFLARLVDVAREPLERRELCRRRDDTHLGVLLRRVSPYL